MLHNSHRPKGRQAGSHSCPPGDLISHLSGIGAEIPADGKQSYRAIGEPPPAVTPLGHTDASLPVPPSPQHTVGRGGKRKSDRDTAIKIKCTPFPFCSFSIQLSILIKRLGPIRGSRGDGPWRIRLYCPTL